VADADSLETMSSSILNLSMGLTKATAARV
jgi:hypothetical protein